MSMCVENTPVEHYPDLSLWVKREDQCCPGGPNFSKTRGVYAHVRARNEGIIGVLDTAHSQGGWAVARACSLLGRHCVNYYPVRKSEQGDPMKPQQAAAMRLGATMVPLQAGRSAVIYHQAKKLLQEQMDQCCDRDGPNCYMMPNALKLPEMVGETSLEWCRGVPPGLKTVLVSASSGTIAAGVARGMYVHGPRMRLVVHMGYSRPEGAMRTYMDKMGAHLPLDTEFVDEDYSYADQAQPGPTPPFPCNGFYDLKAFRWWMSAGRARFGEALLWNIG